MQCAAGLWWSSNIVLDSDGSVDDPDAPNQITEGTSVVVHSAFVVTATNPRKLMPSVSYQPPT